MKITNVKVFKLDTEPLVGSAQVVFDDEFVVTGIKIIKSKNSTFIAMPDKKDKDGKYHEVCHPISKECREKISEAVLSEYFK